MIFTISAIMFIESLQNTAFDIAPHKPKYWFRYVDDTFVIWPHEWLPTIFYVLVTREKVDY